MSPAFKRAMAFTGYWEGGEVNHAKDPGGHTNLGIIQKTLDDARRRFPMAKLPVSVAQLTIPQAEFIYEELYWKEAGCHRYPDRIAIMVFDSAVNCGVNRSVRWLQRALKLKPDGIPGSGTAATAQSSLFGDMSLEFQALRWFHYMTLDDIDDTFGRG